MDVHQAILSRRMVRSFDGVPVDTGVLAAIVADATRAPSAGNTGGTAWLSLTGPEETARYWERTTTAEWRERSRRWPGLSRAPAILLSLCRPDAYVLRYGEPDKAGSGLGPVHQGEGGAEAWPVPYWFGDAAFETMLVLLGVTEAGLGACFLGNFRGEARLLESLAVPDGWRLFGAIVIGHPDGADPPSPSAGRRRPGWRRMHAGRWEGG